MNQSLHLKLVILLMGLFTFLGSVPHFDVTINYVFWFIIIYLLAAYVRFYPLPIFDKTSLWGWISLGMFLLATASVIILNKLGKNEYMFLSDSNKLFAVGVAFSSFLWFKNLKIKYSRFINIVGGSTFGVLLIHANSDAMRHWLWRDFIDCVGHYQLPIIDMIAYTVGCVLAIFTVCVFIDQLRIIILEKPFLKWFDNLQINKLKNAK